MRYFFICIVIFFSACTYNLVDIEQDHPILKSIGFEENFNIYPKINTYDWYQNVDINKYYFYFNATYLFFEKVEVDIDYELRYGPVTNIKKIFDGTRANILYKDSEISYLQLKISKTSHLNMIIESIYFDEISYIYGFSDNDFLNIVKNFDEQVSQRSLMTETDALELDKDEKHLSKWSVNNLLLEPLIKRVDRIGM